MKVPVSYMQTQVELWVNYGCPAPREMGSFFRALLMNDLRAAAMFADDQNRPALADWAMYVHNELPALAHGSGERLEAWHRQGGLFGRDADNSEVA